MITITHEKGFAPFVMMAADEVDILHGYQYAVGITQPRYPMPAIIVEYEYGRRWPSGQVVLIECIRGPYDDNDDGPYRQWLADNGWR